MVRLDRIFFFLSLASLFELKSKEIAVLYKTHSLVEMEMF